MGSKIVQGVQGIRTSVGVTLKRSAGVIDAYQNEHSMGVGTGEQVIVTTNAVMSGSLIHAFGVMGDAVGFSANTVGLTSFKNFPVRTNSLVISGNPGLSDWQGCPDWSVSLDAVNCGFTSINGLKTPWRNAATAICHLRGNNIKDLNGIENLTLGTLLIGMTPGMNALRLIAAQRIKRIIIKSSTGEVMNNLTDIIEDLRAEYPDGKNKVLMRAQRDLINAGYGDLARF